MVGDHIQGWMSEDELKWLNATARAMRSVVEIGSWRGWSTFALCESGCPQVIAVDHFHGSAEQQGFMRIDLKGEFEANVGHFKNLMVIPKESREAAPLVGEVDMAFIDASHDYESVKLDLELWSPKCQKIISGHHQFNAQVRQAVLEYFGREPDKSVDGIWIYHVGDGVNDGRPGSRGVDIDL